MKKAKVILIVSAIGLVLIAGGIVYVLSKQHTVQPVNIDSTTQISAEDTTRAAIYVGSEPSTAITTNTAQKSSGSTTESPFIAEQKPKYYLENPGPVVAVVGDAKIHQSVIDFQKEFYIYNRNKTIDKIDNDTTLSSAEKEQLKNAVPPLKSDEEILKGLIRSDVIKQEAIKIGIDVKEQALEEAKRQMALIKNTVSAADYEAYNDLLEIMKGYGMNEDEYVQNVLAPLYESLGLKAKLKEQFVAALSDSDKANADTLFEQYVDELVKNASVQILK